MVAVGFEQSAIDGQIVDDQDAERADAIHQEDFQGAVGTIIADRPPHRSVRAALPHTALTLDMASARTPDFRGPLAHRN